MEVCVVASNSNLYYISDLFFYNKAAHIREILYQVFTNSTNTGYLYEKNQIYDAELYLQELHDSALCLVPEGLMPWTGRLSRILLAGCIPVILSDGIVLPYENAIDWRKISIKISRDTALSPNISAKIEEIFQSPVSEEKSKYIYDNRYSLAYAYDGKSGAICLLLFELSLRLNSIVRRKLAWSEYFQ